MRKTMLVVASVALAMVVAGGVAWAATIRCPNDGDHRPGAGKELYCYGTARADTMLGTDSSDNMFDRAGTDTLYGRAVEDWLSGGKGSDKLYGGEQNDGLVGGKGVDKLFGGTGADGLRPDNYSSGGYTADDYLHGGMGRDYIVATWAIGGVDRIYGEDGDDIIFVSQRSVPDNIPVSKAIVDCGPGTQDDVTFDEGVDVVMDNCETKHPF